MKYITTVTSTHWCILTNVKVNMYSHEHQYYYFPTSLQLEPPTRVGNATLNQLSGIEVYSRRPNHREYYF